LFGIEHTNRDTSVKDGVTLPSRFNVPLADIPADVQLNPLAAPDSYGYLSGIEPDAQPRGIGTLPGGIPIYKNGVVVGGIGVFFPGQTGYASEENSSLSADFDPSKRDRSLEAEYIAFATVGDTLPAGGRIDLVGITLDLVGPGGDEGIPN